MLKHRVCYKRLARSAPNAQREGQCRPDVMPIHDYGVLKGFALTYGKKRIPTPRELAKYGERWRPYRTVAS